jgi:hypothetical protein
MTMLILEFGCLHVHACLDLPEYYEEYYYLSSYIRYILEFSN